LLRDHPLRGRKRRDAATWIQAVELWTEFAYGVAPARSRQLAELAESLRAGRRYNARLATRARRTADSELVHYLGGFFSGEGSFALTDSNARIVIRTRRDDRPLLEEFATTLGLGSVCDVRAKPPQSPVVVWHVTGARQMAGVVGILDRCGLRGRKQRQYRAWRPAALEITRASSERRPRDLQLIARAREELRRASEYTPESWVMPDPPTEDDVDEACVGMLQQWAARTSGPLTAMTYEAERDRWWANRNTIAKVFGSWAAALAAAELR
jgi:hypothetical protein